MKFVLIASIRVRAETGAAKTMISNADARAVARMVAILMIEKGASHT